MTTPDVFVPKRLVFFCTKLNNSDMIPVDKIIIHINKYTFDNYSFYVYKKYYYSIKKN